MGPRLDGRGDDPSHSNSTLDSSPLQWGRASMGAVMSLWTARRLETGGASMGPRLDGRGDDELVAGLDDGERASMGPRLDGRGDVCNAICYHATIERLQWGRASMGAVIGSIARRITPPSPLQWGRASMGAVISPVGI